MPFRLEQRTDFLPLATRRTPSLSDCKPNPRSLEDVARFSGGVISEPVSFVVSRQADRRDSSRAHCHVHAGTFPSSSFVRLGKNVYISSPELCFVQMASCLPLSELLLLGYELCGTYTTQGDSFKQRPPLTSVSQIHGYLEKAGSIPGILKARRAAKYLADGSASPKESQLALLLGLPRAMGGYGLGIPLMNKEVSFLKGSRKATSSDTNYVDLCWPDAKLVVEYDSDLAHTGTKDIAHDAARRNALLAAGMTVITVTKEQLMSYGEMEKVAHVVAQHLGVRIRSRARDETSKRKRLRWELLRTRIWADLSCL